MRTGKPCPLADDIRASLREAIKFAAGKRTKAVVHTKVIRRKPKAARRALARRRSAA